MNFIVRNLGWILLIIFFIFMLYLISNQDNVKKQNIVNTGSVISTGSISLEKSDNKLIVEKYNSEKNKISEESKIEGNKKGFLDGISDLFTFDTGKSDDKINEKLISKNDSETNTENEKIEKNIKKIESDSMVEKKDTTKKDINKKIISSKEKEINTEKNISEKIKNKIEQRNKNLLHKVGVHSIALNNPYFTKKVGYAYKGDKLEQLTNTNKYGCFNSEVLESKISKGTKGWTCIYYMEGHLNEISKYQKESINYYKKLRAKTIIKKKIQNKIKYSNLSKKRTIVTKYPIVETRVDGSVIITKDPHRVYEGPTYNTEVGSLYLVRVNSLILNNETFTTKKGYLETCTSKNCDVLEQLTPVNEKGCFKVNVFMSKINKDKRGWVCQKYLR